MPKQCRRMPKKKKIRNKINDNIRDRHHIIPQKTKNQRYKINNNIRDRHHIITQKRKDLRSK